MKTSPHDRIRLLASLWEDTSPESVNELRKRLYQVRLKGVADILVAHGANAGAARREVRRAGIWLARLDADLAGLKLAARNIRRLISEQIAAVNMLIEFYEGSGGAAAVRVVGKALIRQAQRDRTMAQAGSVTTLLPGLYSQRRALDYVLQALPKHRSPRALQAVFIANEALRFERLTGVAAKKTVDPDDSRLVGPFHDYIRALARSLRREFVFTTRDVLNGLALAREPDGE